MFLTFLEYAKCTSFEEQKGTQYIWGNIYFGIIVFNCLSPTKPCLRFLLICFAQNIKGFYQNSLQNAVDFRDIMNISQNILAKNLNLKKLRQGFVDESNNINSSCHWKTLIPFCLQKKRPENSFLRLIYIISLRLDMHYIK